MVLEMLLHGLHSLLGGNIVTLLFVDKIIDALCL